MSILGKTILITGGAQRVGRAITLGLAEAGADVIIHYANSKEAAESLKLQILDTGKRAEVIQADFNSIDEINKLIECVKSNGSIYGLVNNAAVYADLGLEQTTVEDWNQHLQINMTAPFLLSKGLDFESHGRIINILDWRALRPVADHFPYMISKAGLHAMTRSLAVALAPDISVNGIAFGAILPASDGSTSEDLLQSVPLGRWAKMDEVVETVRFILEGPNYITGDVIHLDGGRHLI